MSPQAGDFLDSGSVETVNPEPSRADEPGATPARADESSLDDSLLPRLRIIEDQPLDARADAYAQVYDELREQLEGGDIPLRRG
jgi:hypothetical protein